MKIVVRLFMFFLMIWYDLCVGRMTVEGWEIDDTYGRVVRASGLAAIFFGNIIWINLIITCPL